MPLGVDGGFGWLMKANSKSDREAGCERATNFLERVPCNEGKWIPVSTPFKFASIVAWRWQIQSSDSVAPAIAKRSAVGQKSSSPLLSSCSNTVATADFFFGQPLANTSLFIALKIKNSCLFGRNIVIFGRQDRPSVQRQGRQ